MDNKPSTKSEAFIKKSLFGEGYEEQTFYERLWKAFRNYWLVDIVAWEVIIGSLWLLGKGYLGLMIFAVYFGIAIFCSIMYLFLFLMFGPDSVLPKHK